MSWRVIKRKWYLPNVPEISAEDLYDRLRRGQSFGDEYIGKIHKTVDARGWLCPKPILESRKVLKKMKINEVLEILTTDPGSKTDIPSFVHVTGQELLVSEEQGTVGFRFLVRKLK
jgi:tRNA 2-thiouridine synthesizing protein A